MDVIFYEMLLICCNPVFHPALSTGSNSRQHSVASTSSSPSPSYHKPFLPLAMSLHGAAQSSPTGMEQVVNEREDIPRYMWRISNPGQHQATSHQISAETRVLNYWHIRIENRTESAFTTSTTRDTGLLLPVFGTPFPDCGVLACAVLAGRSM